MQISALCSPCLRTYPVPETNLHDLSLSTCPTCRAPSGRFEVREGDLAFDVELDDGVTTPAGTEDRLVWLR